MSGKKTKLLFGTEKRTGYDPELNNDGKEGEGMNKPAPYMVFETEADYADAIGQELRRAEKSAKPDNGREKLISGWQKEAAELKSVIPDFDFASAIRSEPFRKALLEGKPMAIAYILMTQLPKPAERDELHQNARSPRRGTGEATINPAKLSSEDFKKYINNLKNQ